MKGADPSGSHSHRASSVGRSPLTEYQQEATRRHRPFEIGTRTIPEPAPPFLPTLPRQREDIGDLQIQRASALSTRQPQARNSDHEFMTITTRILRPQLEL
ncbi:hypothetical protein TNCV_1667121 [Trichonephila clavipes]|nr:hypothetical protein TNCV_1667121 [Trichonephila clavipes]